MCAGQSCTYAPLSCLVARELLPPLALRYRMRRVRTLRSKSLRPSAASGRTPPLAGYCACAARQSRRTSSHCSASPGARGTRWALSSPAWASNFFGSPGRADRDAPIPGFQRRACWPGRAMRTRTRLSYAPSRHRRARPRFAGPGGEGERGRVGEGAGEGEVEGKRGLVSEGSQERRGQSSAEGEGPSAH